MVSETQPNLQLLETYGVPGSAETKEYDKYLQNLKVGMKYRFRAVLNPVVAVSQQGKKRGRIMPEVTVEYQMRYLLDRTEKNGFSLNKDEVEIVERGFVHWHKGKTQVRLCRVAYEGILTITDVDIFRQVLVKGIGKKKAYGFGMVTVIPLKE